MSETDERHNGIRAALGVAYAEHMHCADLRDRAIDGTMERRLAQVRLEETKRIMDGISLLLPSDPANSPTPSPQ